ncbi:hypothetical protein C2I19_14210 [Chromobacterium alticapitis]|uniref:Uncharacterized protein n=1 Tax=Chromobacterium alticapitis TaxID=2073169 RepID=A0A2S5DDW9_9NEIS|nr:hypothetical protein C2I19_14210 [Chromobacterium alticapitis]
MSAGYRFFNDFVLFRMMALQGLAKESEMMNKIQRALAAWGCAWWQGMRAHARQACRDEAEALARIRSRAEGAR